MPASQQHIHPGTPMGATLVTGGAAFRVWAPAAHAVYAITDELGAARTAAWTPQDKDLLTRQPDGTWTGFMRGLRDGSPYRYWVVGDGGQGFKRDPYARELGTQPAFPDCDCLVRDARSYPWHDQAFRPPPFHDLIVYQFHVGVYYAVDGEGHDVRKARRGRFLDLLERVAYLRELGINAVQPLPIQEFPSQFSLGYNGTDYFSPEMDYQVEADAALVRYLATANHLLADHGQSPLALADLRPGPNQLKAVVDLCHLNGIAVIFDVVYNHAGGGFDDQSMYFMDRRVPHSNADSLYFTEQGWAGGLVFDFRQDFVRQLLIDNARFLLEEYHADGLRYDEVSVIDNHGGWRFCQDLSGTVRYAKPEAVQLAEYWNNWRWLAVTPPPEGMGFDAALAAGLRDALRAVVREASRGGDAPVSFDAVRDGLARPYGFPAAWRAVQCVENHDVVYADRPAHEWQPRIAFLADPADRRSWYARSRARVATGLLLTAPGIPMLFMGQEFLEDKNWSDNPEQWDNTLIWWEGLVQDPAMRAHLAFTRDLVHLRRREPALRAEPINVFHVHNTNRVIAFHRWVEGAGVDVVVVASLNESTFWSYRLGFPRSGRWHEVLNSDYYDNLPNPQVAGNGGAITAGDGPMHGLPYSGSVVIPANGLIVFAAS
jgi:1,4-alpha-glucan branching enzyme